MAYNLDLFYPPGQGWRKNKQRCKIYKGARAMINMGNNGWKTTAIIFIILFILTWILIIWGMNMVDNDEENLNECYYNVCGDYPDAYYEENFCYCYEYGVFSGELEITKTEYMK